MKTIKPKEFVIYIRENLTNKFTFSSTFSMHYISKFSDYELKGMKSSLERELELRRQGVVEEKIKFLTSLGYKVTK